MTSKVCPHFIITVLIVPGLLLGNGMISQPGFAAKDNAKPAAASESSTPAGDESPAPPEGRKRTKNKRVPGPDAAATEHGKQETPGKYNWHASLLSDLRQQRTETKTFSGGSGHYDLDLMALYVTKTGLEIGGALNYSETTEKGDDEASTSKNSLMLFRLKSIFNFGNIQKDPFVFFAGISAGIGSGRDKEGGGEETQSSVTRYGLGLGAHYFVDSNVALTAEATLDTGATKIKGASEEIKVTEIHFLKLGFSLFL